MEQIRIHGRGGQGVLTTSHLIAIAAFKQNKYAQAFPYFGVERSGAPIKSYVRINTSPILTKERVYQPSILIILDHTLLKSESDIKEGINKDTIIIINAPKGYKLKQKFATKKIYLTPATEIAINLFNKTMVNTVILGALAKYSKVISLQSLKKAIREKFKDKGRKIIAQNIEAIESAYYQPYEKE